MTQYYIDGIDITGQQFEHNGIRYAFNWCELASQEERDMIGISTIITPDIIPDGIPPDNMGGMPL